MAGNEAVELLVELLSTNVKKEGLQTARGGRAGPVLYPSSLEYAQGISATDNDILTTRDRYFLPDSKKLAVGKYVPDPKLLVRSMDQPTIDDFIKNPQEPTAGGSRQASASGTRSQAPVAGGGGEADDVPTPSTAHPKPPPAPRPMGERATTVVSSTLDDPDDKNWEDMTDPEKEQAKARLSDQSNGNRSGNVTDEMNDMQLVARRSSAKPKKEFTKYRLVQPLFPSPMSSGTLFFPIWYPNKPTTKERTDPRGIARDINNRMFGEFKQPSGGLVVSQHDNLNKMGLYKIGPGAVAFKSVSNAFEVAGLRYTPGNDWNVMWAKRANPEILALMNPYQRINHFIGAWGIGRKDNLHKNVMLMKRQFGKAFDIVPASFVIPGERNELEKDFAIQTAANEPGFIPTYICKPVASSCGKGIHLVQGLPPNPKAANKSLLVQRYIGNPLLIEGRKFDLRIYVAATSFDPMRIYTFDEGLVRFAAEKYPGPDSNLENTHMHLTNYSVNKTAALAKESVGKDIEDDDGPVEIKWLLSEFKDWIIANAKSKKEGEARWAHIESQMHDIIIKSMLVVEMDVITQMRAHSRDGTGRECFELYGFDLIVDENFRLDLLEVNIMPSLATGFSIDKAVKSRLLAHLLTMVGVIPYDRRRTRLEDGGLTPEEENEETSRQNAREQLNIVSRTKKTFSAASGGKSDIRYHYTLPKGHGGKAASKNHSAISADFIDEPLLKTLDNAQQRLDAKRHGNKKPDITASEIAMLIESDEELHRSGGWARIFPVPYNGQATKSKYFHLFRCGVLRKNYLLSSWEEMKGQMIAREASHHQATAGGGVSVAVGGDEVERDSEEEDEIPGPIDG